MNIMVGQVFDTIYVFVVFRQSKIKLTFTTFSKRHTTTEDHTVLTKLIRNHLVRAVVSVSLIGCFFPFLESLGQSGLDLWFFKSASLVLRCSGGPDWLRG